MKADAYNALLWQDLGNVLFPESHLLAAVSPGLSPISSSTSSILLLQLLKVWCRCTLLLLASIHSSVYNPTLHSYLSTSKICRVELCTVFYSCSCHFFSSRCMLELKFAIYYRAASLPSQASYAVSQAFFKHSPYTNSICNSAFLCNNYISVLSDLCACVQLYTIEFWNNYF